jgi:hypothetical protein
MSVPSSELAPSPASKCVPPGTKGGRVRGRGEPIRTTVEKAWHSVNSVVWLNRSPIPVGKRGIFYLFKFNSTCLGGA